jgi:hypothetical protein
MTGGTNPGVCTELMSDIAGVIAGVMIPGFTYPPEKNPLKKLEFKNCQTGFADSGDASDCSAVGSADISCGIPLCAPVPAAGPVTWATAAAWPASPAGLVVGGGCANGVNTEAAAELPA